MKKTKEKIKEPIQPNATEKLYTLLSVLESAVIDVDKTIIGSEVIFIPSFDEIDRGIIKNKILNIIKDL